MLPAALAISCPLLLWAPNAVPQKAAPPAPAPAVTSAQVRQAVERSLPFLEKEGLAWMRERKCIACHHGAFLLWSHNEARRHGIAVDPKKTEAWTRQALGLYLAQEKDNRAKKSGYVEATNLVLAQAGQATPDAKATEGLKTVAGLLVNGQRDDGSWKYQGQGQKRPAAEADEATTLWAILAVASVEPDTPAYARVRERALSWVRQQRMGEDNEAAALRLVIERRFGDAARAATLLQEVIRRQNPDGGWSWAKGFASDPYATGQSLYALSRAGVPADDPAVQRGLQFLLARQKPDGSWHAPTKKPTNKDNPIAAYWGSAWASIGLASTLGENGR